MPWTASSWSGIKLIKIETVDDQDLFASSSGQVGQGSEEEGSSVAHGDYTDGYDSYQDYSGEPCDPAIYDDCDVSYDDDPQPQPQPKPVLTGHCKGPSSNRQCNGKPDGTPCTKGCRAPDCFQSKCCKVCCKRGNVLVRLGCAAK